MRTSLFVGRRSVFVGVIVLSLFCSPAARAQDGGVADGSFLRIATTELAGPSVRPELLETFTERLTQALRERGADVFGALELARRSDGAALNHRECVVRVGCLATLRQVTAADAVTTGEVSFIDSGWRIELQLRDARTGEELTSASVRATTDEEAADQISRTAYALAPVGADKLGRTLRATTRFPPLDPELLRAPRRGPLVLPLLATGSGVFLVVGSAALLGYASELRATPQSLVNRPAVLESYGYPLMLTGIALCAVGAVSLKLHREDELRAFMTASPAGFFAGIGGPLNWGPAGPKRPEKR